MKVKLNWYSILFSTPSSTRIVSTISYEIFISSLIVIIAHALRIDIMS